MTNQGLARIERLLGTVIDHPAEFTAFQVDFTTSNVNRIDRFGTGTLFSAKQHAVLDEIGERIGQLQQDGMLAPAAEASRGGS